MPQSLRFDEKTPSRLDAFVASLPDIKSRVKARSLIEGGQVCINGRIVKKPSQQIRNGDELSIDEAAMKKATEGGISAQKMDLPILYEDDSCLVIDKPAGVSAHPGSGMEENEATLLHGLAFLFKKKKLPFSHSETLVHRLDKETTGCLLVAKTPAAHLALQKQFKDRRIHKQYLAIVHGIPSHAKAVIDSPIGRSLSNRTRMSVMQTSKTRQARTAYTVLDSDHGASLILCEPETGRTHQIRVHMASIGHPLLGDQKYGSDGSLKAAEKFGIEGLCLHAWKISFTSPHSKEKVEVMSKMPALFQKNLEAAGLTLEQ